MPTKAEVEKGLTGSLTQKIEWAKRTDYSPTHEQAKRGIQDVFHPVRLAFLERHDVSLTDEINEHLFRNEQNESVLVAWLKRHDCVLSDEQMEDMLYARKKSGLPRSVHFELLLKENANVSKEWVLKCLGQTADTKEKAIPSKEQIVRGCSHPNLEVRQAFSERRDGWELQEMMQKAGLNSTQNQVKKKPG